MDEQEGGEHSLAASRRRFEAAFSLTLDTLIKAGKKVVVIGQLPMQAQDSVTCSQRRCASGEGDGIDSACAAVTRAAFEERAGYITAKLKELSLAAGPKVLFIDPAQSLCTTKFCRLAPAGTAAYANDNHVNTAGAQIVLAPFAAKIKALSWQVP